MFKADEGRGSVRFSVGGKRGLGKFGSPVFINGVDDDSSDKSQSSDSKQFPFPLNLPNSSSQQLWFFSQNSFGETRTLDALAAAQANPNSGLRFFTEAMLGETGYWNPAVVTDKDGKASVTFRLPERSTAWRLRAAGIDAGSLAGEADADLVAKKDFFGEMKLPGAFTAGDRADVLVDVQNASVESGAPIEVRLKLTLKDRTTELKKSLVSRGPGIESLVFPVAFGEAGTAQFELTVASGDHRDVTRAAIPVRADGLPVFSSASGTAGQSTIALVDADPRLAMEHPRLEILIGPSVNRTLLDTVLGSGPSLRGCDDVLPTNSLERATSDVLGGVALLAMIRTSRSTDTPEATALAVRVRVAIAQTCRRSANDGGWSWSGGEHANASDRFLSSRAAWALSAARRGGFVVPADAFDRATAFLSSALVNADLSQRDVQAALFHALCECGKGDFAIGNRLYRERNRLGNSALLHVALGLARLDRKEMAGELLNLVKVDIDSAAAGRHDKELLEAKAAPALRSSVELRALYLLAIEEIQPTSDKGTKLADWLLAARQGSRWRPDKANGPAVAALARWFRQVKPSNEKYTLTVYVNDHRLEALTVDPSTDASRRLEVPANMLVQGRPQRINFDMEGRGRFSYSAILSGFVPSERLAATTGDWFVQRWYEPAQRMLDGEPVPRGFDVVSGSYTIFRNELTQLPVGTRGEVTLSVSRRRVRGTADEQLDYLVITEPIPAGASVLADSVRGSFERYEISRRHDHVLPGRRAVSRRVALHAGRLRAWRVSCSADGRPQLLPAAADRHFDPQDIRRAAARHGDARRVQIDAARVVLSGQAARRQGSICQGSRATSRGSSSSTACRTPCTTRRCKPCFGPRSPRAKTRRSSSTSRSSRKSCPISRSTSRRSSAWRSPIGHRRVRAEFSRLSGDPRSGLPARDADRRISR